jgi:hypothetical protein
MSRSRFLSPNKGHSYEELKTILPGAWPNRSQPIWPGCTFPTKTGSV